MSDNKIDELSENIGYIKGKIENIEVNQSLHAEKLEKISDTLTVHRIKVAGISGGVSLVISLVVGEFKKLLTGHHT